MGIEYDAVPDYHKYKVHKVSNRNLDRVTYGYDEVVTTTTGTLNKGEIYASVYYRAESNEYIGVLAREREDFFVYMKAEDPAAFLRLFTVFSKVGEVTYSVYHALFEWSMCINAK